MDAKLFSDLMEGKVEFTRECESCGYKEVKLYDDLCIEGQYKWLCIDCIDRYRQLEADFRWREEMDSE